MATTAGKKNRTKPSVDTTTNGNSSPKNYGVASRSYTKVEQITATTEVATKMFVSIIEAVYKGETALAIEIGPENYTQVAQSSKAAAERIALAMTEAITLLGREAIKVEGVRQEASRLRYRAMCMKYGAEIDTLEDEDSTDEDE